MRALTEYLIGKGDMIKETLRCLGAPDIGGVRAPLYDLEPEDLPIAREAAQMIRKAVDAYIS